MVPTRLSASCTKCGIVKELTIISRRKCGIFPIVSVNLFKDAPWNFSKIIYDFSAYSLEKKCVFYAKNTLSLSEIIPKI
jgi:hypothetical protein